ncbi:MAG TPA: zinc ABC transporter substrate-binding protein [Anaerolineales bacterium]|nr:zinc ABC transporter substrate-binding protein [Anaerolineales bacterium]
MSHRCLMLLLLTLLFSSCGGTPASDSGETAPVVLTSTPLLADITRNIAGDRVQVESLLPAGTDPHSYQPTPRDAAKIFESRLIIVNGAGYEQFLESLLESAGGEATIITASAGIGPREDTERSPDPHMWLDPNNVILYVENIRDALTHLDPQGEAVYKTNADAYLAKLKEIDAWILEQIEQIPSEKRLLVTNHKALGYFADRYGFKLLGTVIESFSSDASPSAQQLASLIDQIKSSRASAIFLDASDNATFARQIADETGVRVITDLHLESLTDGAPASTYIDMMKHNVTQIVNALE